MMTELIKQMMAIAEAVATAWAISHPDIPPERITEA